MRLAGNGRERLKEPQGRFKSCHPDHVGAKCALLRFSLHEKHPPASLLLLFPTKQRFAGAPDQDTMLHSESLIALRSRDFSYPLRCASSSAPLGGTGKKPRPCWLTACKRAAYTPTCGLPPFCGYRLRRLWG